jgi:hypothetical protein
VFILCNHDLYWKVFLVTLTHTKNCTHDAHFASHLFMLPAREFTLFGVGSSYRQKSSEVTQVITALRLFNAGGEFGDTRVHLLN